MLTVLTKLVPGPPVAIISAKGAHENIQQQVYTRIWQSVVRIVHTLDFTVEDPSQLEEDEAIGGLNDGEEGVPQGDDESETGLGEVHALVFQVSDKPGHKAPGGFLSGNRR